MIRHFLQNLSGFEPQVRRDIEFLRSAEFCHGFAVARIELGNPIDLELAFCLTLIALWFEIACGLLKMGSSLFLSHRDS